MAKRKYSSRWREPTAFSKFLALMLFILLPLFFFWFGMQLQSSIDEVKCQGAMYEIPQDILQLPTPTPGVTF
ncbi:MAG: hypothetical protein A2152_04020 [Candidatus Levybacteria bacterium RBG_16_35_6]|nr:MAG: hypothetical protein A2152_04020 [Candidatus Levybacteria bacterium RBG_16_35_6]